MTLPEPNLDDRSFADLVAVARARIQDVDPTWTDLSVHDPAMVLVEAFAHLTDILLYRLNRVPDKLYVAFLNLIGTKLRAPSAAIAELEFRPRAGATLAAPVRIPRGTKITTAAVGSAETPVFATLGDVDLAPGATSVRVMAVHADDHEAEVLRTGTGQPALSVQVGTTPIVHVPAAPGGDPIADLIVAVEADGEVDGPAVQVLGATFELWEEVDHFADLDPSAKAYTVDRVTGTISFGSGTAGAAPPAGKRIVAWYRSGGGAAGNVAAGTLTVLRDPPAALEVTNPAPAAGGRDVEPLAGAMVRGPQEFHARDRAITARDFELLARRSSGAVARAKAFTRTDLWPFARPGEVEVVIVPDLPEPDRPDGRVTLGAVVGHQTEEVRRQTQSYLDDRCALGATTVVRWANLKPLAVCATVVIRPEEDAEVTRQRILRRLHDTISPLPATPGRTGSTFGEELRVSNVYRMLEQREPGVLYAEDVHFELDEVPDADVTVLTGNGYQAGTWFVASGHRLFRSSNDGAGWEAVARFEGEPIRSIVSYPNPPEGRAGLTPQPGLIALATRPASPPRTAAASPDPAGATAAPGASAPAPPAAGDAAPPPAEARRSAGSRLYVSRDLGERWERVAEVGFGVADLAWLDRGGVPVLLMASDAGLYELPITPGAVPVQNLVDPADQTKGFTAVETVLDARGRMGVALAAEASEGIYLSPAAGVPDSFVAVGRRGEDIRGLAVQYDGPSSYLWVVRAASGENDPGTGCARLRLDDLSSPPDSWQAEWTDLREGWTGGTCWAVAFGGGRAVAASQSAGVLRLDPGSTTWATSDVRNGLPMRDVARFQPERAVGVGPDGQLVLAGGPAGVFRSGDGATHFTSCADRRADEVVTLPSTWLFVSGEHRIEVVHRAGR